MPAPRARDGSGRRRAVREAVAAGLAALALAATAGVASAHAVVSREFAAPVPLGLVFAGAGATVGLTALWLGAADRTATARAADATPRTVATVPASLARPLAAAARVGFLALVVAALVHGVLGRQVAAENLATLVVWPLALKGVALVSVAVGSPWRTLSPWETLYDGLVALEGRELAVAGSYPDRLGAWPAVVGFVLGVGILENLTVATRSPSITVAVAASYAVAMVLGAVAFGREWFARADALTVLFDLLGRVAPLVVRRGDDGDATVAVRPPWAGASRPLADASLVAFVVAAVYTVSFDGFTATRVYRGLLDAARETLGVGVASVALYAFGLVGFLAAFAIAAAVADRLGTGASLSGGGTQAAAAAFGATVVPIAAAYEVAHNYPYVAANLGAAVAVVRDLALGENGAAISPLAGLSVELFWLSQVALVVAGHLVAVVAAHRVATRRYGDGGAARRPADDRGSERERTERDPDPGEG